MLPRIPTALALATLLTLCPDHLWAQQRAPITPGQRVRILDLQEMLVEATFVRVRGDTFVVAIDGDPAELHIPLGSIQRVEVSETARSAADGATLGFLIGALAGGGLIFVLCVSSDDCGIGGIATAAFAGLVGAVGAAIGGLIGRETPGEIWRDVTPELRPLMPAAPDPRARASSRGGPVAATLPYSDVRAIRLLPLPAPPRSRVQ